MKNSGGLIVTGLTILISIWVYFLLAPTVTQPEGKVFEVARGSSIKQTINNLGEQGIISQPYWLTAYTYFFPHAQLKAGEYFFPKGSSPITIWSQIIHGSGFAKHAFIIVPGTNFQQLKQLLLKADGLKHQTKNLTDQQIMQHLGADKINPEGEFFPDTYYYIKGNPDFIILQQAYNLMQSKLNFAWMNQATNLPYKNSYEVLIAASLVEKEAYLAQERKVIAGVIANRLRKNMLLQIDPTVIYGMGSKFTGKISKENLTQNTPYNTYVNHGLPPTPIAMPSFASIEAVVHPEEHDFYYFVAKGDGSHIFSKTLTEHNAAVAATIKKTPVFFNEGSLQNYLNKEILKKENNL